MISQTKKLVAEEAKASIRNSSNRKIKTDASNADNENQKKEIIVSKLESSRLVNAAFSKCPRLIKACIQ